MCIRDREYERCKAEYDKEKKELDKLYELQKQDRKEAVSYTHLDVYKRQEQHRCKRMTCKVVAETFLDSTKVSNLFEISIDLLI